VVVLKKLISTILDRSSSLFVSSYGDLNMKMRDPKVRSREAYFSNRDEQVGRFY